MAARKPVRRAKPVERPTTKPRWQRRSKAFPGSGYSVHPNDSPHLGKGDGDGYSAWLDDQLVGWAPTISEARGLCMEWEDKS